MIYKLLCKKCKNTLSISRESHMTCQEDILVPKNFIILPQVRNFNYDIQDRADYDKDHTLTYKNVICPICEYGGSIGRYILSSDTEYIDLRGRVIMKVSRVEEIQREEKVYDTNAIHALSEKFKTIRKEYEDLICMADDLIKVLNQIDKSKNRLLMSITQLTKKCKSNKIEI